MGMEVKKIRARAHADSSFDPRRIGLGPAESGCKKRK
jgi:hypothetical protein